MSARYCLDPSFIQKPAKNCISFVSGILRHPRYFILILIFSVSFLKLVGFLSPLNPPVGNWYQQFFPNLNGRTISDATFADSLTGYAVTKYSSTDTNYILRSTNGGDTWSIVYKQFTSTVRPFRKIHVLSRDTVFVGGNKLLKTANAGLNWSALNIPSVNSAIDFHVLNNDTIWFTDDIDIDGGLFRTIDKGSSWDRIYWGTANNPEKIYMYNARIGFMSRGGSPLNKTTDGGFNWTPLTGGGWTDIYFTDSLTGWKANSPMNDSNFKKTTHGGFSWFIQRLPFGGNITMSSGIYKFEVLSRDTIWGVGGALNFGSNGIRAIIYRSTSGGSNWLFQLPDTSFGMPALNHISFTDKLHGWAYTSYLDLQLNQIISKGIHTTTGGDPNWIAGIRQINNQIPKEFRLFQNYPNPFNPETVIKYQITTPLNPPEGGKSGKAFVQLIIYDITGKEVITLVNEVQTAGTYQVDFSGYGYSSGVYFYSLVADSKVVDTKKMILVK